MDVDGRKWFLVSVLWEPIVFESRPSSGSLGGVSSSSSWFTREEYEMEARGRRTSGIIIRYLFREWAVRRYTPAEFLAFGQCQGVGGWMVGWQTPSKRIPRPLHPWDENLGGANLPRLSRSRFN